VTEEQRRQLAARA